MLAHPMKQVLRLAARQRAESLAPVAVAAAGGRQQQVIRCSSSAVAPAPSPALQQQQRRPAAHACGAPPQLPPAGVRRRVVTLAGLPFSLAPSRRPLKFKWGRRFPSYSAEEMQVEVDALLEGSPAGMPAQQLRELLASLQQDCGAAVPYALVAKQAAQPHYRLPAIANVSLVLCDDGYIRQLNRQYRGKDAATDVLSFELPDEEVGPPMPVKLLGDLVISVDTAARQAAERGHSLQAELRVLLVHGLLHLAGFDHEKGQAQHEEMAGHEAELMAALGWEGSGLISAAEAEAAAAAQHEDSSSQGEEDRFSLDASSSSSLGGGVSVSSSSSSVLAEPPSRPSKRRSPQVKLVALDMDGTLLDGASRIAPASVRVIRAAADVGVRVILATGKARPAAIAACRQAGLEGDGLLVSQRTPGIFLQGLAVHGQQGRQLSDAALPVDVVARAFSWAGGAGVSCVAFLGDECATLQLTDDLRALHTTYYEPLAQEAASLEALLAGPAVRKLLFMAAPELVEGLLKPHWGAALAGSGAELLQAVPNMLEVVPAGVNKWAGLQVLLEHLGVQREQLMAVGDGSNDLQMVANAGIGVAMGNAVPGVKVAAAAVVASNDDGGIVEAFERYVL